MNTHTNTAKRLLAGLVMAAGLGTAIVAGSTIASADTQTATSTEKAQTPAVVETQAGTPAPSKVKLKGIVTRRDADTFTVQDANGVDTRVSSPPGR